MAAGRSQKSLVGRRRRLGGEEEDEHGPVMISDSQSEGSGVSEGEDNTSSSGQSAQHEHQVEGEQSGLQDVQGQKTGKKNRKSRKKGKKQASEPEADESKFKSLADTEAMMNGLRIGGGVENQIAEDFETAPAAPDADVQQVAGAGMPSAGTHGTSSVRQRRDHEDYRRKRDADPAFIPNRGTFFMHDTRGHANAQSGPALRGAWQARARGGTHATAGGPFSPAGHFARAEQAAEQPWKHDLHDTINEGAASNVRTLGSGEINDRSDRSLQQSGLSSGQGQKKVISFSSTTVVGKVQIRVALPGMKAPISFSDIAWKHYVRLPNHRPPLRRDKPVRISIPPNLQRFIFPSPDRSFIFIPRQLRPNQQGYRGGGYQRSMGGYGYSSRRTSMYGGSMYAASIAASRRSSIAGMSRADAFSPTSFNSNRPVVRLPYGKSNYSGATTPSGPMSGHHTPTGVPQLHTYPLPQQPTYQGTPTTTMHQPRPQKAISVTGIESPVVLQQAQPPQDHLPFQNQLPAHMNEEASYGHSTAPFYSPRQQQQYGYLQHQHSGTPLSGAAEQPMQMPGYQAPAMPYAQAPYYPAYPPQQIYYYPPSDPNVHMPMPMYMPGPQAYMVPPKHVPAQQAQPPVQVEAQSDEPQHHHKHQPSQSGMVAHESNGMVYYLPAAEAQQQASTENFQPAEGFVPSYAMPGLPPPTPGPESLPYYGGVPVPGMPSPYYPAQ